jgi:hypothetical protein
VGAERLEPGVQRHGSLRRGRRARARRGDLAAGTALGIDEPDVEDPTTEFSFSTFGVYELTILTRIVTGQSLVPNSILLNETFPIRDSGGRPLVDGRVRYESDRELARCEMRVVVRVASRRHDGTQADFERSEPEYSAGRRRSLAESFPEHRTGEALSTPFLSSPLPLGFPADAVPGDARAALDGVVQRQGAGRLYVTSGGALHGLDLAATPRGVRLEADGAHDGVDQDGDGVVDDAPDSPAGRSGDDPNAPSGDAVWPTPTQPTIDSSAEVDLGSETDASCARRRRAPSRSRSRRRSRTSCARSITGFATPFAFARATRTSSRASGDIAFAFESTDNFETRPSCRENWGSGSCLA